jgi:thiol-disulfide isomerase/thioredoxin
MKRIFYATLAAVVVAASAQFVFGDGTPNAGIQSEVAAVTAQVAEKFKAGKTTEADMAGVLKTINGLIVKYQQDGNREQLARLYLLDAHIYADALDDNAKAAAIWAHVTKTFPGTKAAFEASKFLTQAKAKAVAPEPQVPEGLEVGMKFPGFSEKDSNGRPLSVAAYKGKVVLIDFWATWCGPCKAELPNVLAVYRKYHAQGFEIIGVSLDENRNSLANFTQAQGMVWPQYFDGQGWENKVAVKYGVHSIPMTYLLDRRGIIIGESLRGEKLGDAVAKALAGK